jgi:hypothetical protein
MHSAGPGAESSQHFRGRQRRHRRAAALEVHRELRGDDGEACRSLLLECGPDFSMELRTCRGRRALVEHFPKERVAKRVRLLAQITGSPRTWGGDPTLLADELVARLGDTTDIPLRTRASVSLRS